MSTYVPSWVKTDATRFPRVLIQPNSGSRPKMTEVLSPFSPACMQADTKAFVALMTHLKEKDKAGMVIMMQVENEVGILGDSRDRSGLASRVFDSAVPESFLNKLCADHDKLNSIIRSNFPPLTTLSVQRGKSWAETFGTSLQTDEMFMAYHYALYIEHVASAGRKVYEMPMFTNAWLRSDDEATAAGGGNAPGMYPSGGPIETVIDIWQTFAPTLDFLSPDIYHNDYETMWREYSHRGQPLFIPEQRRDEFGALRIWQAIGDYRAICTSPFGIDTLDPANSPFTRHYTLLKATEQHILTARSEGRKMTGFYFDRFEKGQPNPSKPKVVTMDDWKLTITPAKVFGHPEPGYGLIIQQSQPDTFLLIGEGYQVGFLSTSSTSGFTGILGFDEKEVVDEETGKMRTLRRLNGDETQGGKQVMMPSANPDYGGFAIAITIPGKTRIAECRVYSLAETS
jgi:hypothetical protein